MMLTDKSVEGVLYALADPTRRQLLHFIASRGQASATILATKVTVSRQAVAKHLTVLSGSGLVTSERIGREVLYRVCTDQLVTTAKWMEKLAADWDKRLEWVKRMAEAIDESE